MMDKNRVQVRVQSFRDYSFIGSLDGVIERFQACRSRADVPTDAYLYITSMYDNNGILEYVVCYDRLETDAEYEVRIARDETSRQSMVKELQRQAEVLGFNIVPKQ